jgi:hypothetical protein
MCTDHANIYYRCEKKLAVWDGVSPCSAKLGNFAHWREKVREFVAAPRVGRCGDDFFMVNPEEPNSRGD